MNGPRFTADPADQSIQLHYGTTHRFRNAGTARWGLDRIARESARSFRGLRNCRRSRCATAFEATCNRYFVVELPECLGRGVEHAILQHLGEVAIERGLSHIEIAYLPTSKNEPARAFAEDVVGNYRRQDGNRVIYCVPADNACTISHRPGHDPAAVIEAKKSEEKKDSARAKSNTSKSGAAQSQRYTSLAQLQSGRDVLHAERRSAAECVPSPKSQGAFTVTEGRLLELWEETLDIDGLGVEDNYFALGGTSLDAARLFAEVARHFGVRLRLTAILRVADGADAFTSTRTAANRALRGTYRTQARGAPQFLSCARWRGWNSVVFKFGAPAAR